MEFYTKYNHPKIGQSKFSKKIPKWAGKIDENGIKELNYQIDKDGNVLTENIYDKIQKERHGVVTPAMLMANPELAQKGVYEDVTNLPTDFHAIFKDAKRMEKLKKLGIIKDGKLNLAEFVEFEKQSDPIEKKSKKSKKKKPDDEKSDNPETKENK